MMNSIPLYNIPLGSVACLLALTLILVGCAGGPPTVPVSQAQGDAQKTAVRVDVAADADVAADFENAMKHLKAGEYEKGADLLRNVAQRSPAHTAPYINLAMAYEKMGKLPAAEESIKKALELNPGHPVANTEYGLLYRKTGRFAEARQAYERTLKQYPDFLPARKNLGILCDIYLRDLECALTQYQVYSSAMPDDKAVRAWIADLEQRRAKQAP
jgi:tetratricopeptide (TPR) repeat protein